MIEDKQNYMPHLEKRIKNTNQKLYALNRVKRYMGFEQNKIMSFSIKSQFSYCQLVWMFSSRTSMNKLKHLQKLCTPYYKLSLKL